MKISNKKIIVSTLALAMGAALAGSISGSVAWYQYSTRAAAQITGTSAGTVGELQIRGKLATATDFTASDTSNKLSLGTADYKPMSMYVDGSDVKHYVDAPVYQEPVLPEQRTGYEAYIDYELQFRFIHNEGKTNQDILAKPVYLSYFDIEKASGASQDLSEAVRVAFDGEHDFLLSDVVEDDSTTTEVNELETITNGKLDLNGNGALDKTGWDCTDTSGSDVIYKNAETGGEKYACDAHASALAVDTDKPYELDNGSGNDGRILVTTNDKDTNDGWSSSLKLRIWLEGWEIFGSADSATWADTYIAQNFNVNMQFICQAERV